MLGNSKLIWVLFSTILGYTLVSCGLQEDQKTNVFHYNQHNPLTSLDPAFAKSQSNIWPVGHIYSTLVRLDDSLHIKPDISRSWGISEDGLTYTFYLRKDVYFHDDVSFNKEKRRVVAQDVLYSFNRIISKEINSPGSWIFKGKVAEEMPFKVVNDSTFEISLQQSFGPFLSLLTMQYCSIVPREAVEFYGTQFFANPVGSGPFKFRKWIDNNGLFLVKNEKYYRQLQHNLEGIRTSFIPDRSIALLELINGGIDFMSGIESSYVNTALNKEGELRINLRDKIALGKNPYLNFEYLGINMELADRDSSLLRFREFRQALNYAIDRELMLNSLRNGIGIAAQSGAIPKGLPSFDESQVVGYSYDIDLAKEKMKSVAQRLGYDDLANFDMEPLVISTSKDYLDLTTFIARQWEELGLRVEIDVMESAILRDRMRKSAISIFRASWIADYPDGENYLSLFYGQYPAPPNYTRYSNQDYDRLYNQAMESKSPEGKMQLYHEMNRVIVEDAPVIFLFYDETANFYQKDIQGMPANGVNFLNPEKIRL